MSTYGAPMMDVYADSDTIARSYAYDTRKRRFVCVYDVDDEPSFGDCVDDLERAESEDSSDKQFLERKQCIGACGIKIDPCLEMQVKNACWKEDQELEGVYWNRFGEALEYNKNKAVKKEHTFL